MSRETHQPDPRLDLDELLAFWKPALGLSDWVIRVEYDLRCEGLGATTVWWRDREARVRICEPSQITREWPPVDVELTFVHELVHCVVEIVMNEAKAVPLDVREQIVEQLAKSLVRLHRVFPLDPDWLNRSATSSRGLPVTSGPPTTDPADHWIAWRGSISDYATDLRAIMSPEQLSLLVLALSSERTEG